MIIILNKIVNKLKAREDYAKKYNILLYSTYFDFRGAHIFSKCIFLVLISYVCTLETKSNQSLIAGDSCLLNVVITLKVVILKILNKYNSSLRSSIDPVFCDLMISALLILHSGTTQDDTRSLPASFNMFYTSQAAFTMNKFQVCFI